MGENWILEPIISLSLLCIIISLTLGNFVSDSRWLSRLRQSGKPILCLDKLQTIKKKKNWLFGTQPKNAKWDIKVMTSSQTQQNTLVCIAPQVTDIYIWNLRKYRKVDWCADSHSFLKSLLNVVYGWLYAYHNK